MILYRYMSDEEFARLQNVETIKSLNFDGIEYVLPENARASVYNEFELSIQELLIDQYSLKDCIRVVF